MKKNDIFLSQKIWLKEKWLILVISDFISKFWKLNKIDDLLPYIEEGRNSLLNSFRILKAKGIIKREKYTIDNKTRFYYLLDMNVIKSNSLDNFIVNSPPIEDNSINNNSESEKEVIISEDKPKKKKKPTIKEKTFEFFEEEIFNYWNEQNIIIHKKATKSMFKFYLKLLEDGLDVEDIKKWIEVYWLVYNNPNTFFKYRWSLAEFLQRKNWCRVFCDKTLEDYLTDKISNKKAPYIDSRDTDRDYWF